MSEELEKYEREARDLVQAHFKKKNGSVGKNIRDFAKKNIGSINVQNESYLLTTGNGVILWVSPVLIKALGYENMEGLRYRHMSRLLPSKGNSPALYLPILDNGDYTDAELPLRIALAQLFPQAISEKILYYVNTGVMSDDADIDKKYFPLIREIKKRMSSLGSSMDMVGAHDERKGKALIKRYLTQDGQLLLFRQSHIKTANGFSYYRVESTNPLVEALKKVIKSFETMVEQTTLLNIMHRVLPEEVLKEITEKGLRDVWVSHEDASILCIDMVNYTGFIDENETLGLNAVQAFFWELSNLLALPAYNKLRLVKTMGDGCLILGTGGDHSLQMLNFASEVLHRYSGQPIHIRNARGESSSDEKDLTQISLPILRMGLEAGPVMSRFTAQCLLFDVEGTTVINAARLEAGGEAGCVCVGEKFSAAIPNFSAIVVGLRATSVTDKHDKIHEASLIQGLRSRFRLSSLFDQRTFVSRKQSTGKDPHLTAHDDLEIGRRSSSGFFH